MKTLSILTIALMAISFEACSAGEQASTNEGAAANSSPSTKLLSQGIQCRAKLTGENLDQSHTFELDELGQGVNERIFTLGPKAQPYAVSFKYKALPSNRSYPANLDITLSSPSGEKRGYLFFALNDLSVLRDMGQFGFITEIEGGTADLNFKCGAPKHNTLRVSDLANERLFSDTLISKKGFQMIRPMLLPKDGDGRRSQSFSLDSHPFEMDYTLVDLKQGGVQFQYNLSRKTAGEPKLAARFYYNAPTLKVLRQGMFAGKFFEADYGTIKMVYYPALGQTMPTK